jgi:hypothetical protein
VSSDQKKHFKTVGTAGILVVIFVTTALGMDITNESEKVMSLSQLVPQKINDWEAEEKDEIYNRDTIFDYINGAGEVYRLYGFRELFVRRFAKTDESDITVEIFDMSTSEDAYGIFSHGREGKAEGIGQGSEYRGGLLCFWKSKFFVCVFAEEDTPPAKKAVMNLAKAIDGAIKFKGTKPGLLDYLPELGLIETSIRYFHTHVSLNYHYYIADKNILNLNQNTQAVLARYQEEKSKCYLLLLQYPNVKESRDAFKSFEQVYLPEAKEPEIIQTEEGKWTGADLKGKFVAVVLDAPTRAFAQTLIEKFKEKLKE